MDDEYASQWDTQARAWVLVKVRGREDALHMAANGRPRQGATRDGSTQPESLRDLFCRR